MSFYMVLYFYFISLSSLIYMRKHILLSLMLLEFVVLSLLIMIVLSFLYSFIFYYYLFMMMFYVCESVLGLTILVTMIRNHGNDYLNVMFKW
uniref:NADH-ubiquinone oxidoreductase chain 4L n=1 Tax=Cladolidia biungulata TaxID=2983421 RepID=A0A977XSZ2_9HEMI|nr:NADH dehydrogenase subunit 4L [Cladolidia biungulata]UXW93603.1 NADH dehydrogenase subunit 4L [Cladolidia biungulata]